MIQLKSIVRVMDNSGCFLGQCIGVLGNKKMAKVGDILILSIRGVYYHSKIKKGDVFYGVVVRSVKEVLTSTGDVIKFSDNAVVLINSGFLPQFNRLFGPISYELWPKINKNDFQRNYLRFLSLSLQIF